MGAHPIQLICGSFRGTGSGGDCGPTMIAAKAKAKAKAKGILSLGRAKLCLDEADPASSARKPPT
jgi:hypothetical protein